MSLMFKQFTFKNKCQNFFKFYVAESFFCFTWKNQCETTKFDFTQKDDQTSYYLVCELFSPLLPILYNDYWENVWVKGEKRRLNLNILAKGGYREE